MSALPVASARTVFLSVHPASSLSVCHHVSICVSESFCILFGIKCLSQVRYNYNGKHNH